MPLKTCTECFGVIQNTEPVQALSETMELCESCAGKTCSRCLQIFSANVSASCYQCKKSVSLKCNCVAYIADSGNCCICRDCITNEDCPFLCIKCNKVMNDELAQESGIQLTDDNTEWVCNDCGNRHPAPDPAPAEEPANEPETS